MLSQCERRPVKDECFRELPAAVVNFGHATNRRKIFRCGLEDVVELGVRRVEIVHLEQRAAQRDSGGQVAWMDRKPCAADRDRLFIAASPPVFFGELRKRDRRRVLLDPASKLLNTGMVGHGSIAVVSPYGMIVTGCVVVAVLPALSVIVRRTVYVNGWVNLLVVVGLVDVAVAASQVVPATQPKSQA